MQLPAFQFTANIRQDDLSYDTEGRDIYMRSDAVKKGSQQAPHRSLFNALGFTKEEMERPMVGIVSSYNEIVPGHMNLDKIVDAVKQGVAVAGGTLLYSRPLHLRRHCHGTYRNEIFSCYKRSDRGFH